MSQKHSNGSVVLTDADEALRSRLFPGIAFRGTDWERRPWVIGTALDVWEIIRAHRDFGSVERMAAETDLTEAQIRLALAYSEAFPEEIDAVIADDGGSIVELHIRFPTVDIVSVSP